LRRLSATIIIIAVVFGLGISIFYFYIAPYPIQNPFVKKVTFTEYGFTIEVPAGVPPNSEVVNSTDGMIFWNWNEILLSLEWEPATSFHFSPFFNGYIGRAGDGITSGNTTISGMEWSYVTYRCANGSPQYESSKSPQYGCYYTIAERFYPSENRTYTLTDFGRSDNTLAEIDSWGSTFSG
jgi:hypothetical protein